MAAKSPRNIRQVGNPDGTLLIYIEDYALTYLKSEYNADGAVLVGESCYEDDRVLVFIRGAISCPQLYWRDEGPEMSQRTWNYIFREKEQLYKNSEVVGWYMPVPSENRERTLIALGEFHGRNFPGIDRVFFYLDAETGEESFYYRDGQVFKRQSGYYVFYEKNMAMREYMLALKEERQLEADLYREIHGRSRENIRYREYLHAELERQDKRSGAPAYVICVLSVVAVFALVIGMVSGYRRTNELALLGSGRGEELVQGTGTDLTVGQSSDTDQFSGADQSGDEAGGGDAETDPEIEGTQFDTEVDAEKTEIAMVLAQGYYVVGPGEGLAEICRKLYGDEELLEAICEKNEIEDPNTIYPGQIIYLP